MKKYNMLLNNTQYTPRGKYSIDELISQVPIFSLFFCRITVRNGKLAVINQLIFEVV